MDDKEIVPEIEKSVPADSSVSGSIIGLQEPVAFEEYLHYAALQRHAESNDPPTQDAPIERKKNWFESVTDHKGPNVNIDPRKNHPEIPMSPEEEERAAASRSMRLATWASVFYLITADILGPFNAPFAISQVGWVPGELFAQSLN